MCRFRTRISEEKNSLINLAARSLRLARQPNEFLLLIEKLLLMDLRHATTLAFPSVSRLHPVSYGVRDISMPEMRFFPQEEKSLLRAILTVEMFSTGKVKFAHSSNPRNFQNSRLRIIGYAVPLLAATTHCPSNSESTWFGAVSAPECHYGTLPESDEVVSPPRTIAFLF